MATKKILLVDDRDIVRDSLRLFFTTLDDFEVSGEASNGEEAMSLVREYDYDLVLMDINMPVMDGVEATRNLVKIRPDIKILAYSFNNNPYYIVDMINAGASGYIAKDDDYENYVKAINTICNGELFLSDNILHLIYDKIKFPHIHDLLES